MGPLKLILLFIALIVATIMFIPNRKCTDRVDAVVLSVGGCNRFATCGVQTTEGHMTADAPAVGDHLLKCTKYELGFGLL